jgi:hypothetical protein
MGSKYTGIKSLIYKQPELKKFLRGKGYSSPGQPKVDWFVKATILIKIEQYSKNYKISKRKAWFKLCSLSSYNRRTGFIKLMRYHFRNKSEEKIKRFFDDEYARDNFYKNHVKKWLRGLK